MDRAAIPERHQQTVRMRSQAIVDPLVLERMVDRKGVEACFAQRPFGVNTVLVCNLFR